MNQIVEIKKEIEIEDLIKEVPEAVAYLMEMNIRCLRCGEPIWGSLENACKEKGFSDKEISIFVDDLNKLLNKK